MTHPLPCLRRSLKACATLFVGLLAAAGGLALRADVAKEYQVKAAFLYNFTRFVEWPANRLTGEAAPFTIAVLGRNPFGDELKKTVQSRLVNGREVVVVSAHTLDEARQAHVVFVGDGEQPNLADLLAALGAAGVLTVGESSRFAARGGMIGFTRAGDKVRFEVNVSAAEHGGLKISAHLQKLAIAVHRTPPNH